MDLYLQQCVTTRNKLTSKAVRYAKLQRTTWKVRVCVCVCVTALGVHFISHANTCNPVSVPI